MGVPKFYRWLSERYPLINQACSSISSPEFDNLYLDMNGIVHNASHSDDDALRLRLSEEQIFSNIFKYIDKLFKLVKPKQLLFMALDGVAPRAKMNQQRQRRFKSAADQQAALESARKTGELNVNDQPFDSNVITPGTEFMTRLSTALKYFIRKKIKEDSAWQKIKIILSGSEVPGEGEHKIMLFIRNMKMQRGYNPNLRHALYGLDADLIFLSLVSHEPHFALLREEVVFGSGVSSNAKLPRKVLKKLDEFQFLHISLLREYIDIEFQSYKNQFTWGYNLERIIDDWVLLAFMCGNDFLAHLPTLDIGEGGLDTLYSLYKSSLTELGGYLIDNGKIAMNRLETILKKMGDLEESVFQQRLDDAEQQERKQGRRNRKNHEIGEDELFEGEEAKNNATFGEEDEKQNKVSITVSATSPSPSPSPIEPESSLSPTILNTLEVAATLPPEEHTGAVIKSRYYRDKFPEFFNRDEMMRRAPELLNGDNVPSNEQDWIRYLVTNYMEGIYWIFYYYYQGVPSWKWYYKFRYAPLASDCRKLNEIKIDFSLGQPFRPLEQLLGTLPPASKTFLPVPYRQLMTSDSPIVDFYPVTFELDMNGKRNPWEAIALIPFIDENRLLSAVGKIDSTSLTSQEKLRNVRIGDEFIYEYDPHCNETYPSPLHSMPPIKDCNSKAALWKLPSIPLKSEASLTVISQAASLAAATILSESKLDNKKLVDLTEREINEAEEKAAFQPISAGPFLPQLPVGVKIPTSGYPFINAIPNITGKLGKVAVNVFGTESKKDTLVVTVPPSSNSDTSEFANKFVGKRAFAEWPYMRECIVTCVYDIKNRYTTHGVQPSSKPESDIFSRDAQYFRSKQLGNRGVDIGPVSILVNVRLFECMKRMSDGSIRKWFAEAETTIPSILLLSENTVLDNRFIESEPPTIQSAFPLQSKVIYIGPHYYGSFATITGHSNTQPGKQSVNLQLQIEPEEPQFTKQIVLQSKLQYYPSYMVAKALDIHPLSLGKVTSSVYIHGLRDTDLGIKIRFTKQSLQVPEYARRVDSWKGQDNPNNRNNKPDRNNNNNAPKDPNPTSNSPDYNVANDSAGSWEYSEKAVALLAAYKKRFPRFFQILNTQPNVFKYSPEQFVTTENPTQQQGIAAVNEIADWLKTVGINNLLLIPCNSLVMAERGVKALEQEASRVHAALTAKPRKTMDLNAVPLHHLYTPNPSLYWSPTELELPELGDRVLSIRSDAGVPLGLRGTVVAVHQSKFVETVFDEEFMSGNTLSGKVHHLRGQTVPVSAVLNLSKPKVLVPKPYKQPTSAAEAAASTNNNTRRNNNTGGASSNVRGQPEVKEEKAKPVTEQAVNTNTVPQPASTHTEDLSAQWNQFQTQAAQNRAAAANIDINNTNTGGDSDVNSAADMLKNLLGVGRTLSEEETKAPLPGLEDEELDPMAHMVAKQKAKKAALPQPNITQVMAIPAQYAPPPQFYPPMQQTQFYPDQSQQFYPSQPMMIQNQGPQQAVQPTQPPLAQNKVRNNNNNNVNRQNSAEKPQSNPKSERSNSKNADKSNNPSNKKGPQPQYKIKQRPQNTENTDGSAESQPSINNTTTNSSTNDNPSDSTSAPK